MKGSAVPKAATNVRLYRLLKAVGSDVRATPGKFQAGSDIGSPSIANGRGGARTGIAIDGSECRLWVQAVRKLARWLLHEGPVALYAVVVWHQLR
jgi:hypothetical protein